MDTVMEVRNADSLSVNPGLRPGQSNQRSMHRNAVPLYMDGKEKSPSIRRALFLSCFDEATFTNLT